MRLTRPLGAALAGVSLAASARAFELRAPDGALLPAAQAFALLPIEREGRTLRLSWSIAPGYYLYRTRIRVELLAPSAIGLGAIRLPEGIAHVDEHFGAVQIYRGLLDAQVPLSAPPSAPLRLRVRFQGCADAGVCYPPQSVVQTLNP